MKIKNLCILVLWTKIASALEGLNMVHMGTEEEGSGTTFVVTHTQPLFLNIFKQLLSQQILLGMNAIKNNNDKLSAVKSLFLHYRISNAIKNTKKCSILFQQMPLSTFCSMT